jgi:hypothetical protein
MRSMAGGYTAIIGDAVLRPAVFYEGEFEAGTVRLWSGLGPFSWDGYTWTGAGTLLGIGEITETTETRAAGLTASLSAMTSGIVALAMANGNAGKSGSIWLALLNAAGALVDTPLLAWRGRLDQPLVSLDGQSATVGMQYESRLVDLSRPRVRRWTHEDQQIDYPGDRFFEFEPALQDQVLQW